MLARIVSGVLLWLATLITGEGTAGAVSPVLPPCNAERWIVAQSALSSLVGAFDERRVYDVFAGSCTFAIEPRSLRAPFASWSMMQTVSVTDATRVAAAAAAAPAVIFDPEAWPMTPPDQQRDPIDAIRDAAAAAHARGAILIATPATDLMRILAPGNRDKYTAFLAAGIARGAARYADVVEIQAQGSETNVARFSSFVRAAAAQARSANPRVVVLAGISTNPLGHRVSPQQLLRAALSVRPDVDGYWLNVPEGGRYCPSCGIPQPKVARLLLDTFAHRQ